MKKILLTLASIIFIAFLEIMQMYLTAKNGVNTNLLLGHIFGLDTIVIAIIAGFYGPIIGFVIGFWGHLIGYLVHLIGLFGFSYEMIRYETLLFILEISGLSGMYGILQYGLYGLVIGIFWKKYNLSGGIIISKGVLLFLLIQIIASIIFLQVIVMISNKMSPVPYLLYFITGQIIPTIEILFILTVYSKVKRSRVTPA